ncbi:MAG: hypothetical protein J5I90_06130 [Caldilineales bacterium]|nr:hypothetical protein [Caldilineales bacterium]
MGFSPARLLTLLILPISLLAMLLLLVWDESGEGVGDFGKPVFQSEPGDLDANNIGVYLYPEDDIISPAASIMGRAGAKWTRTWINWHLIEPQLTDPPTYDWEATDRMLLSARQAGLDPIFLLGGNAGWASDSFCGPIFPEYEDEFQRFLRDAVARYSAPPYNVRLWEIYNEPDSVFGPQGYCFGTRGELYPQSLKLAYEAIKRADPAVIVLFGGISYDFFTNEGGRFDPDFLDAALANGAGPFFDVLAFHYYPAFEERWNAFGPGVAGKAEYLRQELARYRLEKPLALTEIGRPTRGPDSDGLVYDEISTARFVAPALSLARMAKISPIIWFTSVDKPAEPYDYGLLDSDYQPEPSYFAFRSVNQALQGGRYMGQIPVAGEGFALGFDHGDRVAYVAWADASETELELAAERLRLVKIDGQQRLVLDGDSDDLDGTANGRIRLRLTIDPVILWLS